jgi:hypothetical protein
MRDIHDRHGIGYGRSQYAERHAAGPHVRADVRGKLGELHRFRRWHLFL